MQKKRRLIYFAVVFLIVCFYFGVQFTGAWFVAGGSLGNFHGENALVNYLPSMNPTEAEQAAYGKLIKSSTQDETVYLIPGDEALNSVNGVANVLKMQNFSTTSTQVRTMINIDLSYTNSDGQSVPYEGMRWKYSGSGNTYYYGRDFEITTNSKTVTKYVPLLEVSFASNSDYSWVYVDNSTEEFSEDDIDFSYFWNLTLSGGSTVVPEITEGVDQIYDVITSFKVVGEYNFTDLNNEDLSISQAQYDDYFSTYYAGSDITVSIEYYAKQADYMEWVDFSKTLITGLGL